MGQKERRKIAPEARPEIKKPKKKSMRLRKPFYLSFFVCLSKT